MRQCLIRDGVFTRQGAAEHAEILCRSCLVRSSSAGYCPTHSRIALTLEPIPGFMLNLEGQAVAGNRRAKCYAWFLRALAYEKSSMALSPPKASSAGLCPRHAAKRDTTASTLIQAIVTACTRRMRRVTSEADICSTEAIMALHSHALALKDPLHPTHFS
jgi:hypothetical protein